MLYLLFFNKEGKRVEKGICQEWRVKSAEATFSVGNILMVARLKSTI